MSKSMIYAGVGSRETPREICEFIKPVASALAKKDTVFGLVVHAEQISALLLATLLLQPRIAFRSGIPV